MSQSQPESESESESESVVSPELQHRAESMADAARRPDGTESPLDEPGHSGPVFPDTPDDEPDVTPAEPEYDPLPPEYPDYGDGAGDEDEDEDEDEDLDPYAD